MLHPSSVGRRRRSPFGSAVFLFFSPPPPLATVCDFGRNDARTHSLQLRSLLPLGAVRRKESATALFRLAVAKAAAR